MGEGGKERGVKEGGTLNPPLLDPAYAAGGQYLILQNSSVRRQRCRGLQIRAWRAAEGPRGCGVRSTVQSAPAR